MAWPLQRHRDGVGARHASPESGDAWESAPHNHFSFSDPGRVRVPHNDGVGMND